MKAPSFSSLRRRRGIGLVIALAAVVLVTILVVAFLSNSMTRRSIVYSSIGQEKSAELAKAATNLIIQDLVAEMNAGSDRTPANTADPVQFLTPKDRISMLPARSGITTTGSPTATLYSNLFKVSSTSALWPANSSYSSGGPIRAYANNSTMASPQTGQPIGRASWDAPRLMPRALFGTGAIQAPDWILLTRQGPVGPGVVATADLAKFSDPSPSNPLHVVGRFAYTIYEVGGLLDANVAGTHSAATLSNANKAAKTTQALADLTRLPVSVNATGTTSTFLSRNQADELVRWRNLTTYNTDKLTDEQKAAVERGLLEPKSGDQTWINRQDLIDFWNKRIATGADDKAGLAYLTTFSRGLNQPSVYAPRAAPLPSFDEKNPADVARYNHNAPFLSIRAKSDFTRADGTKAVVGEPLVVRKFALSNIKKYLEDVSGSVGKTSPTYKLFGLTRSGANQPWDYDPALIVKTRNVPTSKYFSSPPQFFRLKTLEEVRDENREPNFFELLQASILSGTTGANGNIATGSLGPYLGFEGMDYLEVDDSPIGRHVLQIGANIIDQYDVDGYPTTIYVENNPFYDVYGIEDLPYLSSVYQLIYRFAANRNATPPQTDPVPMGFYFVPILWNPHRQNSDWPSSASRPTEFRFRADSASATKGGTAFTFLDLLRNQPAVSAAYPNRIKFAGNQTSTLSRLFNYIGLTENDFGNRNFYQWRIAPDKGWKGVSGTTTPGGQPGTENIFFTFDPRSGKFRTPDHLAGQLAGSEVSSNFPSCYVSDRDEITGAPINFYGLHYATIPNALIDIPYMKRSDGQAIVSNPSQANSTPQTDLELVKDYANAGHFGPEGTTFTLDYKDPSGIWRPYAKMRRVSGNGFDQSALRRFNNFGIDGSSGSNTFFRASIDPRTDRFGSFIEAYAWQTYRKTHRESPAANPGNTSSDSAYAYVHNKLSNDPAQNRTQVYPSEFVPNPKAIAYYGMLTQNRTVAPSGYSGPNVATTYITDPDGIVRGGDSYRAGTGGNSSGHLMGPAANLATNMSQPVVLNRPFESVGEMSYAFRGQPWKSIDFFTSTSADLALMDAFSAYDAPLTVGGQLNVNTVQAPVLDAIFAGTARDPLSTGTTVSTVDSAALASRLVQRRDDNANLSERDTIGDPPGPYISGVNFFSNPTLPSNRAMHNIKIQSESVTRGLSEFSQSRVWNLLIDLVVQSGKYPPGSTSLAGFSVGGSTRVWVHVALDRFTGKVIDQRVEYVNENL